MHVSWTFVYAPGNASLEIHSLDGGGGVFASQLQHFPLTQQREREQSVVCKHHRRILLGLLVLDVRLFLLHTCYRVAVGDTRICDGKN